MKKTPLKSVSIRERCGIKDVKGEGRKTRSKVKSLPAIKNAEGRGETLSLSQLVKLSDAAWSKLVRLHCNGICEWCGKPAIDSHHMYLRRQCPNTRFMPENGCGLCKGCHMRFHDKESDTGWEIFKRDRPESYKAIRPLKNAPPPRRRTHDMREILAFLRAEIAKFEDPT